MLKAGVGVSNGSDAFQVGTEAATEALKHADGGDVKIAFVFASVQYDQEQVLRGVESVFPGAHVVGASTAGEISTAGPSKQSGVTVMAVRADQIKMFVGTGTGIKDNPHAVGVSAAEQVKKAAAGEELKFGIMFADGLSGNGSEVLRGILQVLGSHFPVVGGSAADDARYKQTFQYHGGSVLTDSVVFIGFSGPVEFSFGVNHGWVPVGLPKRVTKAEGAILKEIDGQPALRLYEDYLGVEEMERMKEKTLGDLALSYPLGIKQEGMDELLLRAPFYVNTDGSIVCGAEVPEGVEVRLMVGSKEEAITAAATAATHAQTQLAGAADLALIFSCHVRDKLFANREKGKEEIDAIQKVIGTEVPLAGFYTYAEQAPIGGESRNVEKCNPSFHNETVVICLLREQV